MGIGKLNEVLKNKGVDCFKTIPWVDFAGKRVAIDLDILLRQHWSIQSEAVCLATNVYTQSVDIELMESRTISAVCQAIRSNYLLRGVTPVIVWGGVAPPEKDLCARRRRKIDHVKAMEKYQKEFEFNKPSSSNDIIIPRVYTELSKLLTKTLMPSKRVESKIVETLMRDGVCALKAVTEAEELCAALCLEGIVHAVYSTDTDNIVRRCPILITKITSAESAPSIYEQCAEVTLYSNALPTTMGFCYEQFVDLCIMLGCDYNDTVPRWGPDKCFKQLTQYKSIEAIVAAYPDIDFSCYNYERCRSIFNLHHSRSSRECCAEPALIDFIV